MSRAERQTQKLIAEQAAQWLMVIDESGGTPAQRHALAVWLRTSPAHVQEYLNAKAIWEALAGKACAGFPDADSLLRELKQAGDTGLLTFPEMPMPAAHIGATARLHSEAPASIGPRRKSLRRPLAAAAAVVALAAGAAALWTARSQDPGSAVYQTTVGKQATYRLPDGSTISLNTKSRVKLRWSKEFRDVLLDEGEALFQVARDPSRPFRVWSGESMVRALGTRFNVYRSTDALTVTVLEGRVEVTQAAAENLAVATQPGAGRVQLGAGEQASIREQQPIRTARLATPERSVAWQAHRLVFESEPLTEVIRQFNRYHATPLVLEDGALGAKRVNGIFDATDRASLVAFLQEFEDVEIEPRPKEIVIRRR